MDLITVKTFGTRAEAEIARAYLEANGIVTVLRADPRPSLALSSGIGLLVSEKDRIGATELLDKVED